MDFQNQQLLSKVEKGIFYGLNEMKSGMSNWEFWIAVLALIVFFFVLYLVYGPDIFRLNNKKGNENKEQEPDKTLIDENTTPDYWTPRDGYDYVNDDGIVPIENERPSLPTYDQKDNANNNFNNNNNNNNNNTNTNINNSNKKKKKTSKGELMVRQTLEEHYRKPFPSTWPEFLRNPETNRKLELDCYNPELKLASEYNGIQHYVWPNFTGKSYEEHIKQRRRDRYKIEVCDKLGISLIIVPYTVNHNFIPEYVRQRLPTL